MSAILKEIIPQVGLFRPSADDDELLRPNQTTASSIISIGGRTPFSENGLVAQDASKYSNESISVYASC